MHQIKIFYHKTLLSAITNDNKVLQTPKPP